MRGSILFLLLAVAILLTGVWIFVSQRSRSNPNYQDAQNAMAAPEFALYMNELGRDVHKLNLSLDARNQAAAQFYLHEAKENIEIITENFEEYEGHPIADLFETFIGERLQTLDYAVATANWSVVESDFEQLITACNACHAATDHPFVRIVRTTTNPYNQDFRK